MTQAGLGVAYLNQILTDEVLGFVHARGVQTRMPVRSVTRLYFNPNGQSAWFTAIMQIVTNVTVLAIVLVGAAVIRERERGTIEHLLVMPVRASEIAMAKILANGAVILLAAMLALWLVVHVGLGIPIQGSIFLFIMGLALFLFSVTALGMLLATLAPSMPQFGLLAVPVYVVAYLLSGAATPVESMPELMQRVVPILPTTQFVRLTQAILYRGAGIDIVWPEFLAITFLGILFLALALARFRSMLARQG
jgi:ABC-2 type transport system permease protein